MNKCFYFIAIFLLCISNGCGRQEEIAQELLLKAESAVESDLPSAIFNAEDILLQYPNTNAAIKARKLLPAWKHSRLYKDLERHFNNFDIVNYSGQMIIPFDHLKALAKISEDFPEYELRDVVEVQIIFFVLLNEIMPVGFEFKQYMEGVQKRIDEVSITKFSSYDEMVKFKIDQTIIITESMFKKMSMLLNAVERMKTTLKSISSQNTLSPLFFETAGYLDEMKGILQDVIYVGKKAIGMLKEDAYDCAKAQMEFGGNIISRFFRNRKIKKCKEMEDEIKEMMKPVNAKMALVQDRFENIQKKAEIDGKNFFKKIKNSETLNIFQKINESKSISNEKNQLQSEDKLKAVEDKVKNDELLKPKAVEEEEKEIIKNEKPKPTEKLFRKQILFKILKEWLNAWKSKDLALYISFYDITFVSDKNIGYDGWYKKAKRIFAQPGTIQVEIDDLKIELKKNEATMSFTQKYSSPTHEDYGQKYLIWKKINDKWLIIKEKWEKLNY